MRCDRCYKIVIGLFLLLSAVFSSEAGADEAKLWSGDISLGYNKASGNTENSQLSVSGYANRKTDDNEFTSKGNAYYSSSEREMDTQKWYGMARYAFSFWGRKWYNFYRLEADHDKFADIDYRLIPSAGLGYWFSDTPDWKFMVEVGGGFEHTNFKGATEDSNEAVLIPRVFLEKKLFDRSRISEEVFFYPSVSETGEYRIHSETKFTNPINDNMALEIGLIDDYDSDPPGDTKRNDVRLISSVKYTF